MKARKAPVVTEKITRAEAPPLGARSSDKKQRLTSAKGTYNGTFMPTAPTELPKKNPRKMYADRPQDFLHKGKKRPETAKLKRAQDLETTEEQDQAVDLHKILAYYRERVVAHE